MEKQYDLCIIGGAGHVGLPLGVAFANNGVRTVIFDINKETLDKIKAGIFPFKEEGGRAALRNALKSGNFFISSQPESISESGKIILVVGTPVDKYMNPVMDEIKRALEEYFDFFRDGQILILRSTVYPGISEQIQNYFRKKGKNIRVSFCPERIVEGKALEELTILPQIISAFDPGTLNEVRKLFRKLIKKIIPLAPIEAELSKLFGNAWRYITFSVANQFYMIAESYSLDYRKIYEAMTEDYERDKDLPRPGFAAGPCLFKDTLQLSTFANNKFLLGHAAVLVNEGLPQFIIQQLKQKMDLKEKIIGILGMAFKAESDDKRDSLSYKLRNLAELECKEVLCHDVYIKSPSFYPLKNVLDKSDIIILAAPHKAYKRINPSKYKDKLFIDIWNFWGKQ